MHPLEVQKTYLEESKDLIKTRVSWQKTILSAQIVLLGILISFGQGNTTSKEQQICYLVGVSLLVVGILAYGVSSTSELYYRSKALKIFLDKCKEYYSNPNQDKKAILVETNNIFGFSSKIGGFCSVLALLSLLVLAFLKIFYP